MGFFDKIRRHSAFWSDSLLQATLSRAFSPTGSVCLYPFLHLWRADLKVARHFGEMAGINEDETTFWRQLATKTFQRR
jgi:hypothetical protein